MCITENPLSILLNVENQYKSIIENDYWKMGNGQKIIYNLIRCLKHKIDHKKFQ